MNRLFPYPTLAGNLELKVVQIHLVDSSGNIADERLLPQSAYQIDEKTIYLWMQADTQWSNARIELEIEGPRKELMELEQSGVQPCVTLVAKCGYTNMRIPETAQRSISDRSIWTCVMDLDRRLFTGDVRLQGYLSGTVGGRPCRLLAESDAWTLYFDEDSSPLPSGTLPVKWIDFLSDQSLINLHKYASEPFFVDLRQTWPTVYLNKGFDGLPELFPERRSVVGPQLALHEVVRQNIAKGAWLVMLQASLAGIKPKTEEAEADWPNEKWQVLVLRKLLPRLYPNTEDVTAALTQAAEDYRSDNIRELAPFALATIGFEILSEGKSLRRAMRALADFIQE